MLIHFLNNGALVLLGTYGLDQAAEKLPPPTELSLFASALGLFVAGVASIRRGRRSEPSGQAPQSS